MTAKSSLWQVKQTRHKDFEVIRVPPYDHYKDFKKDPGCYVLIRIYYDTKEIGAAVCNHDHEILKEFRGRSMQDICRAIFAYEEQHGIKWFTRKDHIAYLGKELKKAELALVTGASYYQE